MSNEIKIHKYFDQDPANWSIIGFLNECELEPIEMKIDSYIKGLKQIVCYEQDIKKKNAQAFIQGFLPSHETGVGATVTSLELSDAKGFLPTQPRTTGVGATVTSLELSDAKGFLPTQHRTHWGTGDLLGSKTRPQKSKSGGEALASVSFDNPFDNQSQDLNNSTIPGSETESINVFNSISSEAKDHVSDDDFMPIQSKQKRNLSLPKADDNKDPKSTDSSSKQRKKSSGKAEKSDISEKIEYQDESVTKTNRQKKNNNIRRIFVLEWNLYEDLKRIVTEWIIDGTNISEAFFRFKSFAESKADRYELKFFEHPSEIL
ncbi:5661_t:CDS:2, partial [Cetraspora pellucida]